MKLNYKAEVRKRLKDFMGNERWVEVVKHETVCKDIAGSSILALMNVSNIQTFPNKKEQEVIEL